MSNGPRHDAIDPDIQAAQDRFLAHAREVLEYRPPGPPLVLPDPEAITLGALGLLVELVKGPIPPDPAAAHEYNRVEAFKCRIPGIGELRRRLNCELGLYLTGPALDEVRRRLSRRTGRSFDEVDRMPISEVASMPWDATAGPPPSVGSDSRTEAAAAPPDREADAADASGSGSDALTPAGRVLAAAYDLQRERKHVSLRAACDRAGVDRAHLRRKYPAAADAVRQMATPDRTPRRGLRNRRTGDIDAVDD